MKVVPMWTLELPDVSKQLADPATPHTTNDMLLGCAVIQARAAIQASVRQERSNEEMVAATHDLVEQTRQLVSKTKWVAFATASAALVAGGAAFGAAMVAASAN